MKKRVPEGRPPKSRSPRAAAVAALARWARPDDPPAVPERDGPAWRGMAERDRAFAFDLLTGVIRWRGMLDAVLGSKVASPLEKLDPKVRAVLWVGAYQLLLHAGMRAYAAVDSSVELAREVGAGRAASLVNAVLRNVARLKPIVEVRHGLSRQTFPRDFTTHIRFDGDVFPDPAADVTAHLAAVTSHPRELVAALIDWHGEPAATNVLIRNNQRPVVMLRADDRVFTPPAEAKLVAHEEKGWWVAKDGWNEAVEKLVAGGALSPQDPTAGKVVRRAAKRVKAPERVLDLCAGLGTKAIQMARAWPKAEVFASDVDAAKLARLAQRAEMVGEARMEIAVPEMVEGVFDVVLVDVPCSNTGVMARRVQSRWRWPKLDVAALLAAQKKIAERGAGLVAPGGVLAYATCSIDPRENAGVVHGLVRKGWRVVEEELTLPSFSDDPTHGHDGGYFAILSPP